MKTVILVVSLLLAANSWAGNSATGDKPQNVYVSTENNVKVYHSKINCCGMFFVKEDTKCSMEHAEKEGMAPCKRCFGRNADARGKMAKR